MVVPMSSRLSGTMETCTPKSVRIPMTTASDLQIPRHNLAHVCCAKLCHSCCRTPGLSKKRLLPHPGTE